MENWNLGAILQELENRQNPPFAPPLHSGYPSPRNRLEATVSQNGCSQRPPSSQSVWDHHLSCVSYTQTGKGQENVINHSHLWGLSLSQIHVLSCFQLCILNYQQKKKFRYIYCLPLPHFGPKAVQCHHGRLWEKRFTWHSLSAIHECDPSKLQPPVSITTSTLV